MPNINLVINKLSKIINLIRNSLTTKSKIFRILFVFVFVFIIFLFSNTSTAFASDRYWIGGTGNWSDTAHWSDSDGGAGGFSVPTSADNVFFSAGSFNVNGAVVTLDVSANIGALDSSTSDQTFTISSSINSLSVYGNITEHVNNSLYNFTGTAYVYIKGNSTITTNGRATHMWNRLYIDGAGITVTNGDDFISNSSVYLIRGILNTNNKNITIGFLRNEGHVSAGLILGSSQINCGMFLSANLTSIDAGTSTINTGSYFRGVNGNWNNVIMSANVDAVVNGNLDLTTGSINNLIINGTNSTYQNLFISSNILINSSITLNGFNSTTKRLLVNSSVIGTPRTITVNGSIVASNVDFRDITLAGSANRDLSAISGGSGDAGGNSGITFTPAVPQWFKHTSGAVNWSDSSKWFSDQAKTIPGRVPLPQDDATFDAGSFTGASTLTVNVPRIGKNMDMSMINQAVTFNMVNDIEVYGSFTLNNSITLNGMKDLSLHGRNGNYSISTFSKIIYSIRVFGSQYTLLSDLYTVNAFVMKASALSWIDLNDFNVSCDNNYSANVAGTAYMGNGTFEIRSNVTGPKFSASTNFFAENSTIKFTAPSGTSSPSFVGDGKTYNKLWFAGAHTGTFDILGSNTISELIIDPGRKVRFTAGTTQQIGKLTANGTALNPITIGSVTGATHTLNYTGATNVVGDYLNISYSNATPANKWFASNYVDSGNNTGWIFANIPDMPTGLTPTAGNTQMSLSWTAPISDGGNAITDYVVEYKLSSDSTWSIFADAISTLTTTTVIGLTNGKSYDFRVYAVNNVGQGTASVVASASPFSPNDRYWVGGTGNWSDTTHWANTDGGVGGQSVPTSTNDVYFSAGSFSVDGNTVTLDVVANAKSLDFSGIDQTMTLTSTVNALNVYGSLSLSTKLSTSFTGTSALYLKATTFANITSNGNTSNWRYIYFDGVGGSWTLQDAINFNSSYLQFNYGTLNTNSKDFTFGTIHIANSFTKIYFQNSSIYCSFIYWDISPGSKFDAGNSTIYINTGGGNIFYTGASYNNVIINSTSLRYIWGNQTFNNLTITGTNSTNSLIYLAGNLTILNNLIINGYDSTSSRLILNSYTIGTQSTITVNPANLVASNVDFRDIRFANPIDLSAISGGSGDAGGNSGITFTMAQPQWFKHTSGAVNWSDSTKWFSDQAKTIPGRVPLPQDDATFDAGSFTGTSTLSVNVPRIGRSLDMSGVDDSVTMSLANDIESYGSYVLGNNIIPSGNYALFLMGRNNFNLNTYNKTIRTIRINTPNGIYTSLSNINISYWFDTLLGTFNSNNFDIVINNAGNGYFEQHAGIFNAGSSLIKINTAGAGFYIYGGTFNSDNSTINLNPTSGSNNVYILGNGRTFNKIKFTNGGTFTGNFDITGNNTINELIIDPGRNVRFTAGTTQQIGKLTANGTALNPITIGSVTGATHTLNYTGVDPVVVNYANISYSNATPANKWFASNSVDGANNTGWIFADEPDAPTAVGASVGDSQVSLSWSPPAFNGGTAITDYAIEYKLTSEPTVWSLFADGVNTNTTGIVTGLTNGLSYDFKVRAINLIGQGIESSIVTATPLTIPNAPTDIIATRLNASASIAW